MTKFIIMRMNKKVRYNDDMFDQFDMDFKDRDEAYKWCKKMSSCNDGVTYLFRDYFYQELRQVNIDCLNTISQGVYYGYSK